MIGSESVEAFAEDVNRQWNLIGRNVFTVMAWYATRLEPWLNGSRGKGHLAMQTLAYFLIAGAFIFFMMRFGCGAHVMGHGHSHTRSSGKDDPGIADGDRLKGSQKQSAAGVAGLPSELEQSNERQH